MTAPVWMATPPEVHSALLGAGPGPASLTAAANAWTSLSSEYAAVAAELDAVVSSVRGGAWEGPSAESCALAYRPFSAWLTQASANSATAAAQHETAAAGYTAALAAMPTLPELAANHLVHGVLLATNFFGINTIPIALNEADYARMWVQAATTMATYQAVSGAALASTPPSTPAPQILKSDASAGPSDPDNPLGLPQQIVQFLQNLGIGNTQLAHDPTIDNAFDDLVAQVLHQFNVNWNPAAGTVNGLDYDSYADASQPIFYVVRSLELLEDFQQFGAYLTSNPVQAFQYLISLELFDFPIHITEVATFLSQSPAILAPAVAPVGAVGGLAGLAGLGGLGGVAPAAVPAMLPAQVPAAALPAAMPIAGNASSFAAPSSPTTPGPPPSPATTTGAPASPAPPTPPPAAGGVSFFPPFVVGPPGIGFGSPMSSGASSSAQRKAPEPGAAAAVAAGAARDKARARRRRRAETRDHGDEFADMNIGIDPQWERNGEEPLTSTTVSAHGAAVMGFAGTAHTAPVRQGAGLTTLAGDGFGDDPNMPMLPETWRPESDKSPAHRKEVS